MTRIVRRFRRRVRQPDHMDRYGNYAGDLMFVPLWEPDPRGEVR